ncbi:MAG: 5-dehydro-4-deoxy-D-glucuronate isomerase [Planctomycetota bacterium]|jgi:4-deoxy-L-threo-5-hexosulose-uronate ketol-isomerase|nr:5-dehydro-4-deoxy-D-glucuronate isomerase [Planctomycetota bacterium]
MDIRYSCSQRDVKRYTTEELRREFFIETLFVPDDVLGVYSHVDRVIAMGAMPVRETLRLDKNIDCWKTLGSKFFLAGRELGVLNIGGPGVVRADGREYRLNRIEGLYVSLGTKEVEFKADKADNPPKFYLVSAPAHRQCPTTLIPFDKAIHRDLGALETSNARTINQFIHPDVLETCQLSLGLTILKPGSVWNTMPAHTHERRMEVYLYFDIPKDNVVFHMMGEPGETRHLVVGNEQAVISPSWSIHSGCGTANYSFIWAMAGENKVFDDMDACPATALR